MWVLSNGNYTLTSFCLKRKQEVHKEGGDSEYNNLLDTLCGNTYKRCTDIFQQGTSYINMLTSLTGCGVFILSNYMTKIIYIFVTAGENPKNGAEL